MSVQGDVAKAIAGPVGVGVAVVLVAGVAYWFLSKKAAQLGKAVTDSAQYVNPASDKNIIYSGVNSVGSSVTGDSSFSLGSWLYDITHPGIDDHVTQPSQFTSFKQQVNNVSNNAYDATSGGDTFISDLINF